MVDYREIGGARTRIPWRRARRLLAEGLADLANHGAGRPVVRERLHVLLWGMSTRYAYGPTPGLRAYRLELLTVLRYVAQGKPLRAYPGRGGDGD